jgi:hypothetical protein
MTGPRRLRALGLMGGALLAICVASLVYLRPGALAAPASYAPTAAGSHTTAPYAPSQVFVSVAGKVDRPVGGYFTWSVPTPGERSGGH